MKHGRKVLTLKVDETGAISSAVERILHTDEVTGSRPVSPTNIIREIPRVVGIREITYDSCFFPSTAKLLPIIVFSKLAVSCLTD